MNVLLKFNANTHTHMNTVFPLLSEIEGLIDEAAPDRVFILTDSNVARIEARLIGGLTAHRLVTDEPVVIPAGEENKNLEEVARAVARLSAGGATRRSLLICVGGGMVTDLGGFVAAIFKRGIRHINVSTTLLGAVDASVGGKTGVDFDGLKNEIGAFHMPLEVLADPQSFGSLPPEEILSGFGEVVKTALIASEEMTLRVLAMAPAEADDEALGDICRFCRDEKMRVVAADPTEKGLRKVLNLGHTAGHALESLMLERGTPVPHGCAIAHGVLVTLIISDMTEGMPKMWVSRYAAWLRANYAPLPFTCRDYERLWQLALHDKKNSGATDSLNFVLLRAPGQPLFDRPVTRPDLEAALDLYQELQGR